MSTKGKKAYDRIAKTFTSRGFCGRTPEEILTDLIEAHRAGYLAVHSVCLLDTEHVGMGRFEVKVRDRSCSTSTWEVTVPDSDSAPDPDDED